MENQENGLEEQKRAFVEPTVTEEASLTEVTLQTGDPEFALIEQELGGLV